MALPGGDGSIEGTSEFDIIFGGAPSSKIYGRDKTDILFGGRGDDYIDGGNGHDFLFGGKGDDWLMGGQGSDFLFGGAGGDQFRINGADLTGRAVDVVADLNFAQGDKLTLFGFNPGTFDDKDGTAETGVGNDLDVAVAFPVDPARYGEGAVIDSVADLVELAEFSSSGVTISRGWCNTLVLTIDNGGGNVQVVKIAGLWDDYAALAVL